MLSLSGKIPYLLGIILYSRKGKNPEGTDMWLIVAAVVIVVAIVVVNLLLTYPPMAWSDLFIGFLRPKHWYTPPKNLGKIP